MEVPQKTKNKVIILSSNPSPAQNCNSIYMHPYTHSSTIYNSQDMETNQMSTRDE